MGDDQESAGGSGILPNDRPTDEEKGVETVQQDHESMAAAGKPIASTSDQPGAGVTSEDYGSVDDIDPSASSVNPEADEA